MKTTLLLLLLMNLLSSCNSSIRQLAERRKSQFASTDQIVLEIKAGIKNHGYLKNDLSHMSQYGGSVYELSSTDRTLGYLYSKFSGEAGATELECYFKDEEPIFVIYRNHVFESTANEYNSEKSHIVFEQLSYIELNKISKTTITKKENNKLWGRKDYPKDAEILDKIKGIKRELAEDK